MSELFNLDDVFGTLEDETKLNSALMFVKKGEEHLLAMLPPMLYDGKPKLSIAVEGEYEGKATLQHVVRFILLHKDGKQVDWSKSKYVGIALAPTLVTQIVTAYKSEFELAKQTCSLIVLSKPQKTTLVFTPKTVTIPDEVWNAGESLTWQTILEAHESMKSNMAKKGTKSEGKDETPWG